MTKWLLGALCAVAISTGIHAQTPAESQLPSALRDWRPWVLKDLDYRGCPFLAQSPANSPENFVCAWPGRLALASAASGATFSIRWRVEAPAWVPLPGDAEHWPQQVTVNGQRQPVLSRGEVPSLWLGVGTYEIAGRIPWREQPQTLIVPPSIGIVALTIDGKPVAPVQRDGEEITLGRAPAAAAAIEADNLDLRVYRRLADGIPAELETRLVFAVAGHPREETLGPVLPEGFAPTELVSAWPARLDGDGKLRVQVQPGSATVVLKARATAPLHDAVARVPAAPWPKQEIWSYEAAPRLRVTAASGAVQVDPRQAEAPGEWQALPAFALGNEAKLTIEERSRGLAPDEGNRLTLAREAWLEFGGGAWYARDRVSGTMAKGWRFDVAPPFSLEQAAAPSSTRGNEPLLVTRGAAPELSGVEWRTPSVDLAAGLHVAAAASMPVAGWQQTFDRVQATLHFPFGYKLLAAPGADSATGSWIAGWNLLDLFLCAIVALLAWRALGALGAAVVAAYLVLGYQEAGSPLWTLLAALAFALIARALPPGKLARAAEWLRRAALLALVLLTLPFVAREVRYALYPQLEEGGYAVYAQTAAQEEADFGGIANGYRQRYARVAPQARPVPEAPPAPPASMPMEAAQMQAAPKPMAKSELKAMRNAPAGANGAAGRVDIETANPVVQLADKIDHYSETTVVQTGRGAPSWTLGSTAWLSFSGPVLANQTVHLVIAPPWLVRPLRLLLAALLAWLVVRLVSGGAGGAALRRAAPAVLALAFAHAPSAQAQSYPPDTLLQQLRERLTEAPKCAPACAAIAEAEVSANGDGVSVALEVHAGERIALPLPQDAAAATLKAVQLDGAAADAIARSENGGIWIAVGRGVHRVQLDFAAAGDKLALAFPLAPSRVLFQGKGWDASGLADDRLLTETLTLTRARDGSEPSASTGPGAGVQQFPPYVEVERDLVLGLEWSATTRVRRLSPAQGGFTVDVPVMAGEHVGSAGIKVENGKIPAAIAEGEVETSWQSTLDKGDALNLTAPPLGERAEVWRVLVSPTWHVEFSGVPGVGLDANENPRDYRNFEFHPLPGETLSLKITRPAPVKGELRAIDAASLASAIGQRTADHVLAFTLRASQGGDQAIALPKGAEVLGVTRDGQTLNVRAIDGRLSLPVAPGAHGYEVRFRAGAGIGSIVRTPDVSLGLPAANVALAITLPGDRWLLAAFGPAVGPAVLYWGELVVMIAVAFALARTRRTQLRFRDWLLLGFGFSTFSWIALLFVVAWVFAFDWRARATPSPVRWRFNLSQIALVVLAIVALVALASAIPQGLAGQPDMHVSGNGSTAQSLQWFADRSADALPQASAVSLPLWVYKVLMFAWALWLATAVIGWLREGFAAWTSGGYWRGKPPATPAPAPAAEVPPVSGA